MRERDGNDFEDYVDAEKESIPNFSDANDWHDIKAIRACKNPKGKQTDRTVALVSSIQIDSTKSILRTCRVHCPNITHTGRHSRTSEAYHLMLHHNEMAKLGRWSSGQMEAAHPPELPIHGAFIMAHFKENEGYFLERDLVTPPLPLQRFIFPWIENTFEKDMPERTASWVEECDREMEGIDGESAVKDDYHWSPEESSMARDACSAFSRRAMTDRVRFLRLLVRMRRVILQDAVLYLKPNKDGKILSNIIIESLPHISKSKLF
ncbi:hypothetical protein BGZ79_006469 [Entomortierella chlamydospora]|nr:hypothetical protein BGZ79_006469 [Entomortierella chlamydospora]